MPTDPNTPNSSSPGPSDRPNPGDGGSNGSRLDAIENRLAAIERRLGMTSPPLVTQPEKLAETKPVETKPVQDKPTEPVATPNKGEHKRAIVRNLSQAPGLAPASTPKPVIPKPAPTPTRESSVRATAAVPTVRPIEPPKPTRPSKPAKPERPPISLEQFIGGKSFLVLGALIVVIGAGFFLKLAVDEGWIGKIPPLARCLAAAAFGAALLVVGELTVKKLGRFAAVGFRAAGLGVLYATSYAAYGAFELVDARGAFVLLIAVCALGIGIALRGRSVTLAVLSLVGGYIAPLIAASETPPPWALAAHLLVLLVVGSVIAVRVPYQRILATLTWWGTALFGTIWATMVLSEHPGLVIGFAFLVWPIVHWTRLSLPPTSRKHPVWAGMPGAASFSTTVWSVGAMVLAAAEIDAMRAWHATTIGLAATLGLALFVAPNWRSLLAKPEGQRGVIGASLLAQAASLLPLTLLLMIEPRWGELLVFVLLGTGAFWAGRRIEAWAMVAYGAVLLVIGTFRVLIEPPAALIGTSNGGDVFVQGTKVSGWYVSPWMGLMLLTAGAWMACGRLSSGWMTDPGRAGFTVPLARRICVTVACVLLPVAFVHSDTAAWATAVAWFGLVYGGYAVARWLGGALSVVPALVYLAMATMWTLSLPGRGDPAFTNWAPLGGFALSWWMVMIAVAAASWLWCGRSQLLRPASDGSDAAKWVCDLRVPCLVVGCLLLPLVFVHGESDRWAIAAGWFALAGGAFVIAKFLKRPLASLPVFGYLAIATLLTLALPAIGDPSYQVGSPLGELFLSWWMLMTGGAGVAWLVCGWRCIARENEPGEAPVWQRDARSVCLVIGCVLLPIMFLHREATVQGVMSGWFALALAAFGASRLVRHRWASAPSAVYLSLVTILWFAAFLLPGWMHERGAVPVFLHPGLIWSLAIGASWGAYAWIVRTSQERAIRDTGVFAWWVGGVLLLISTTLEVARFAGTVTDDPTAQAGSVSIWWAVVAVGLLVGGFARAIAPLRYAGIGLLLVATGKVLTYDLAELSPAVRVGSFIGCGLVLLCVAAWYLRVGAKKLQNKAETVPEHNESSDEQSDG